MVSGRALHFVLKVGDRALTAKFYKEILGMQVLRHEEFTEGCNAACNGPYDNRWSKTMVGYGPEDTHFAVELTYNYSVQSYELGNDFRGIVIRSRESIERARNQGWPLKEENGFVLVEAPGGYKFLLLNDSQPTNKDPVEKVILASSNLEKSIKYWHNLLGLQIFNQTQNTVLLGFAASQVNLELYDIGIPVNHATAYGRIAFSCPHADQPAIDQKVKDAKGKILTPLITLDTPGKATVRVIILADPDDHEICFVDDEGFSQLSKVDADGEKLLSRYIVKDLERDRT